jgi:hypothetical protein
MDRSFEGGCCKSTGRGLAAVISVVRLAAKESLQTCMWIGVALHFLQFLPRADWLANCAVAEF